MIGGALVVETFFRIPGLGTAVVEAVLREDFPVVLAIVMIVATAFMVFNYLADLLYGVIDPRVRTNEKESTPIFRSLWKSQTNLEAEEKIHDETVEVSS